MNVILDEDKEQLHPIGLGRNPTIVFTPCQIEHIKLKLNTKVTVGCISGLTVGAGLEVRPSNQIIQPSNQIYCKLRLSDNSNEIWVLLDDLML
jgi:hypothetical protein